MSKESFKSFARRHSELADYIIKGKTDWQKLYELYEIYGENSSVWEEYFSSNVRHETTALPDVKQQDMNFKDLFNTIKNVDLDSVQKGITNIQKTIGLLQDIGVGGSKNVPEQVYRPRPMYKYFED